MLPNAMTTIVTEWFDDYADGWTPLANFAQYFSESFGPVLTSDSIAEHLDTQLDDCFVKKVVNGVVSYAYVDELEEDDAFFAVPAGMSSSKFKVTFVNPKQVRITLNR